MTWSRVSLYGKRGNIDVKAYQLRPGAELVR